MKSDKARVAKRSQIIHILHHGHKPEETAQLQNANMATVYNHFNRFKAEGIAAGLANKPKLGLPPKSDEHYRQHLLEIVESDLGEV